MTSRFFCCLFLFAALSTTAEAQEVTPDYFIGSWGQVSYNDNSDMQKMTAIARGYCGPVATHITRRSPETFMMYVTEDLKEVHLLEQNGQTYIAPVEQPEEGVIRGARELHILGPNAFTLRYLEDEANKRYGPNIFVRCGAKGEEEHRKSKKEKASDEEENAAPPADEEPAHKPKHKKRVTSEEQKSEAPAQNDEKTHEDHSEPQDGPVHIQR